LHQISSDETIVYGIPIGDMIETYLSQIIFTESGIYAQRYLLLDTDAAIRMDDIITSIYQKRRRNNYIILSEKILVYMRELLY
jgi:hypothetical protein